MVEAIAHVPFYIHQYYYNPYRNLRGYKCTLKKFPVPPKWWMWGYMYPQMKRVVGMLLIQVELLLDMPLAQQIWRIFTHLYDILF